MSTFFVVLPISGREREARDSFERGLARLRKMPVGGEVAVSADPERLVACRARSNGTGIGITKDDRSSTWMVGTGVWLHRGMAGESTASNVLRSYAERGAMPLAGDLEGFFGLVIGDKRSGDTTVITDILGHCHLFERRLGAGTAISNSSLLLASLDEPAVDTIGLHGLIAAGAIYDDTRTLFAEVKKLPASSVIRYGRSGSVTSQQYWSVQNLKLGTLEGPRAADALWEALTASMRSIGAAYPRVVCDITGGHDTRTIIAACVGAPIPVGTTVTGSPANPDVIVARRLAQVAGLPLIAYDRLPAPRCADLEELTWVTDGEADIVEYFRVASVHKRLMSQFDISLNGSMLEIGRGHWWELLSTLGRGDRPLNSEMVARRRLIAEPFDSSVFGADPTQALVDSAAETIRRATRGLDSAPLPTQMDAAFMLTRMQRWHGRIASSTNRIWPSLSPSILRPVLETMLSVAPETRVRSHLVRLMLANHKPDLAAIPLESGYPPIPFSLSVAHRFWPVVPLYAKRVANKIYRTVASRPLVMATDGESQRSMLWMDDAMIELLDPRRMKLANHLDARALGRFLEASRRPEFAFEEQWRCIVSAELALRAASAV